MKLARTTAPRSLSLIFVLFTVACSVAQTGRGYSPQSDQESNHESPEINSERWRNFPSVDITWRDGDRLQGRLIEWRSGRLQIQSNVFRDPIGVDVDLLDSIRLASASDQANSNAGAASESPHAKVNIVLVDGSQLTGNIVEFDEQKVRFQDLRFGEITLPLLQVSSIAPAYDNLYAWSGNFDSWQGETTGPQAQWQVEEGNLKTSHADAQLWLPLSLNQSFSIEFAVQADAPLDFVLAT